ncbi:hypothetical protein Nepgr_026045 [Nepenthes gracilis]|uniref:DUF1990 domain-containing protein n=1 Tax=Nepenthes gracilis TaxID=150966 RepID=A0AAD3T7J6_NEPGR|nr:hypothetical protein Nepgr_026045 [Nepenthes gracilis]
MLKKYLFSSLAHYSLADIFTIHEQSRISSNLSSITHSPLLVCCEGRNFRSIEAPHQFVAGDMVFLCWNRPSLKQQKACIDRTDSFNYDGKFKGATAGSVSSLQKDMHLSEAGFLLNHARIFLGSGLETYEKAKFALRNWRHFQLSWTFVDCATPIKSGAKFCVCVNEFLPWLMLPLQVLYVNENEGTNKLKASLSFGSGTLQGHLLAGEERFSVELDENNKVWYEILSFSKPACFISFVAFPYVRLRQKYFVAESTKAVLKHCSS